MKNFGNHLRNLRKSKGLTMQDIAIAISVPVSTYREWEHGRAITGEPYPRIAIALGISLNQLFGVEAAAEKDLYQQIDSLMAGLEGLRTALQKGL